MQIHDQCFKPEPKHGQHMTLPVVSAATQVWQGRQAATEHLRACSYCAAVTVRLSCCCTSHVDSPCSARHVCWQHRHAMALALRHVHILQYVALPISPRLVPGGVLQTRPVPYASTVQACADAQCNAQVTRGHHFDRAQACKKEQKPGDTSIFMQFSLEHIASASLALHGYLCLSTAWVLHHSRFMHLLSLIKQRDCHIYTFDQSLIESAQQPHTCLLDLSLQKCNSHT